MFARREEGGGARWHSPAASPIIQALGLGNTSSLSPSFLIFILFYFMCMSECLTYIYIHSSHVCLVTMEARKEYQIPWNQSDRLCELPCRCQEQSPGLLEEQLVLLTTEPSPLQPLPVSCRVLSTSPASFSP